MNSPVSACPPISSIKNSIGTNARSSNSSMAKADRPTGLSIPVIGRTRAVDDSASASPSATALGDRDTEGNQSGADQDRTADQLAATHPEHRPPHAPKPSEADVQSSREKQEDDPQLGEGLDRVRIADRDRVEPRMRRGQRAERIGAGNDADDDEADDRRDPEARKCGNDDPGGAKDRQRIAEAMATDRSSPPSR